MGSYSWGGGCSGVHNPLLLTGAEHGANLIPGHGEMALAVTRQVTLPEQPKQTIGGMIHDPDEGSHHGMHPIDDPGRGQAHGLRLVEGQHLGREFPADNVQK